MSALIADKGAFVDIQDVYVAIGGAWVRVAFDDGASTVLCSLNGAWVAFK